MAMSKEFKDLFESLLPFGIIGYIWYKADDTEHFLQIMSSMWQGFAQFMGL